MKKFSVTVSAHADGWDGLNITVPPEASAVTPSGEILGPGSHKVELTRGWGILVTSKHLTSLITVDEQGWVTVFGSTPTYTTGAIGPRVISQGDGIDSQFVLAELPDGVNAVVCGREYTKTAKLPVEEWFVLWYKERAYLAKIARKTIGRPDAVEFFEPRIWETQ